VPWFKVDDGLHAHRKVVRAGIDAMGLWVVAGSWCADQLTDGFIPDYMAQRLDPDFEKHAAALVAAKLWVPGEKDEETGWWFHQWSEEGRQPTAASVNAKRDDARERMAKLRADRAEQAKNKEKGSKSVRANTSRTSQEVTSTPTRPDPTRPSISNEIEQELSSASPPLPLALLAGAAEPNLFDEFWMVYPRHVGKAKAKTTFATKVKNGADATAVVAAARSYADRCRTTKQDPQFIPHPTTWLNRESWGDDLDASLPLPQVSNGGYQPYRNNPDRDYSGSI
jgi:hypothetical protein